MIGNPIELIMKFSLAASTIDRALFVTAIMAATLASTHARADGAPTATKPTTDAPSTNRSANKPASSEPASSEPASSEPAAPGAAEYVEDGEPPDNAVMLALIPLSFAWQIGNHRDNPGSKIDRNTVAALGVALEYQRHITPYFRIGPRLEYIKPFSGDKFPILHEARVLLSTNAVWPLLNGDLELSVGALGGMGLFLGKAQEPPESDGAYSVAPGFTIGATVGARGWVDEHVALNLDVGPNLTIAPENSDGFGLAQIRVALMRAGVAVGW